MYNKSRAIYWCVPVRCWTVYGRVDSDERIMDDSYLTSGTRFVILIIIIIYIDCTTNRVPSTGVFLSDVGILKWCRLP